METQFLVSWMILKKDICDIVEASHQSQVAKSYWERADSTTQCGIEELIAFVVGSPWWMEPNLLLVRNQLTQRTIVSGRNKSVFRFNRLCKEDKVREFDNC